MKIYVMKWRRNSFAHSVPPNVQLYVAVGFIVCNALKTIWRNQSTASCCFVCVRYKLNINTAYSINGVLFAVDINVRRPRTAIALCNGFGFVFFYLFKKFYGARGPSIRL